MTRLSVCSLGVSCNEMIDTPMLLVVGCHRHRPHSASSYTHQPVSVSEAFYTVNLLNVKLKVVPARNSGWKKGKPGITICLEVFEFEVVIHLLQPTRVR